MLKEAVKLGAMSQLMLEVCASSDMVHYMEVFLVSCFVFPLFSSFSPSFLCDHLLRFCCLNTCMRMSIVCFILVDIDWL